VKKSLVVGETLFEMAQLRKPVIRGGLVDD
jgi:hypothetical protein